MRREWDADVELSAEQAVGLIEQQFPALAPARMKTLGAGWDNWAFRVNEPFVFRFPRRQIVVRLIEREVRVLPLLAPHLPLPVPVPTFAGVPGDGYPYPFAGYRWLPGTTACRLAWSEEKRTKNAAPLGRFLATLHAPKLDMRDYLWPHGEGVCPGDAAGRLPREFAGEQSVEPIGGVTGS